MEQRFDVLEAYRNRDWPGSMNFVLRSRQHARRPVAEGA
jgi:hypothetical protein